MSYDKTYTNIKNMFGEEPEKILIKFINKIDNFKPVLDIGAGQGSNSVYLAANGFYVDAIDPSFVGLETINEISKKENYKINTYQKSYKDFIPKPLPYSAILVFGLIQILSRNEINILINQINKWTLKNSLVFLTAFSKKDSSFKKYSHEWSNSGKNSFTDNNGNYNTFLEDNEILNYFGEYIILHHFEGLGPKHRHGNGPFQQHAMVELVVQKSK